MKKAIAILLLVILCISFAACGGTSKITLVEKTENCYFFKYKFKETSISASELTAEYYDKNTNKKILYEKGIPFSGNGVFSQSGIIRKGSIIYFVIGDLGEFFSYGLNAYNVRIVLEYYHLKDYEKIMKDIAEGRESEELKTYTAEYWIR